MKFNMSMKNYDYRTQNVRFGAVLKIYTFMQNLSYGASAILACEIFNDENLTRNSKLNLELRKNVNKKSKL